MIHGKTIFLPAVLVVLALAAFCNPAAACPFCGSGSAETISSKVLLNDLTVTARVEKIVTVIQEGIYQKQATFRVEKVLAALNGPAELTEISAPATPDAKPGDPYLLFLSRVGKEGWQVMGRQPDPAGELTDYLTAFLALGERPSVRARIAFFAPRLESANRVIQDDVVNAFAFIRADELLTHRDVLPAEKLRGWLGDEKIPLYRRSLYAFLLGIGGDPRDAPTLRGCLADQRKNCTPDAAAFFSAYVLLDQKEGLTYLQTVLTDRSADVMYRTQATYAIRILDGLLPKLQLQATLRPALVRLLDDPALAADVVRLLRDWSDWKALPDLTAWYVRQHDRLSNEVRIEVIQLSARLPPGEGLALREAVRKLDGDLVKLVGDRPSPATSTAPGK